MDWDEAKAILSAHILMGIFVTVRVLVGGP